jgi:plastocyanin domain-containing protein
VANISIGGGGYYPREITVKKGIPVELIVDDQIPLGGCMGTTIIPEYNLAKTLKVGKNKLAFNPTKSGVFPITCSMGARMAQLTVVD